MLLYGCTIYSFANLIYLVKVPSEVFPNENLLFNYNLKILDYCFLFTSNSSSEQIY